MGCKLINVLVLFCFFNAVKHPDVLTDFVRGCDEVSGGLTEMKTRSASLMAESMSVEKNKFLFLHDSTTSLRPGWGWGDVENETETVCQRTCRRNMT